MIQIGKLDKEQRKKLAVLHVDDMLSNYSEEIKYSIDNSDIYTDEITNNNINDDEERNRWFTNIAVTENDTVTELFEMPEGEKVTILNFASYKNPGGMFYEGSSAQEEFLCHHSTLYPVLKSFEDSYYKQHMNSLNYSLYTNTGIYSKDVKFFDYDLYNVNISTKCTRRDIMISGDSIVHYNEQEYHKPYITKDTRSADVITCAAPNIRAFEKYQRGKFINKKYTDKEIDECLYSILLERCIFVLEVAKINNAQNLILGAFGCGVFGCNPKIVSEIFANLLCEDEDYEGIFKEVRFAIPKGINYDAFKKTFVSF